MLYELVRPLEAPETCPRCGQAVNGEVGLYSHYGQSACSPPPLPGDPSDTDTGVDDPTRERFTTDRQARRYLARRFLGRDDDGAVSIVAGYLRTAELPEPVQALFKSPEDRTAAERTALDNYGIDARTVLGSGEGRSGTSREVAALHDALDGECSGDALDPTEAVLETVGSLDVEDLSEQQLRRTLRDVRHDLRAELDAAQSPAEQRQRFSETLQARAEALRETCEELDPERPFRKVDVLGPETQRHSRWHARVMARRDTGGHGELVRQLYQERLETIADEEGWD